MKKILILLFTSLMICSIYLYNRIRNNPVALIPFPFSISNQIEKIAAVDAPILIIGDQMAERLGSFRKRMIEKLSLNLSKDIKVISIAKKDQNIYRTLAYLKSLNRLPLIVIYLGGSNEANEKLFFNNDIPTILKNFDLYNNKIIKTALMIFPELSRVIYHPHKRIKLGKNIINQPVPKADNIKQKTNIIHYKMFEAAMEDMTKYITKANSLFIPITPPLNLDLPPKSSCYGTLTGDSSEEYASLLEVFNKKDYKNALNLSKDLVLINPHNAEINFIHSKVLKMNGQYKEAQNFAENALIYDCKRVLGNKVYNTIIKRIAKKYKVQYFDFHQFLYDKSSEGSPFLDEVYPQDVFFNSIVDKLAKIIKTKLRL